MEINGETILGLDILDKESHFSYEGCENCNNGLGNNISAVAAIVKDKNGREDWYDIDLCDDCLNSYYNGEPLDPFCKNQFKI